MKPIIVVGMRSGTSAVSRILQENLGVCMDEGPIHKDWRNPKGYYEDHKLVMINKVALDYLLNKIGDEKKAPPIQWHTMFAQWITERNCKYKNWGFKDPSSIGLIKYMHQYFNAPKWVVPIRPFKKVVESLVQKVGIPRDMAISAANSFNTIIQREIGNKGHYIDMSSYRSDVDLTKALKRVV